MSVKKHIAFMVCLVYLISLLNGCGLTPADKKTDTDPVSVSWRVYTETIKDEADGKELLEIKITYPEFNNPENKQGIDEINEYFRIQFDDFITNIISDGVQNALADKEAAENGGYEFMPHYFERSASIEYNGNNLISVHSIQTEFTGGAHPNTAWLSATFDVNDGKKLALTDIFGGTEEEALNKVYELVEDQIEAVEGTNDFVFNENYKDDIKKNYDRDDFVLTPNSIKFYYQIYAIAPYAAGIPTFELSLDKAGKLAISIPEIEVDEREKVVLNVTRRLIENNLTAYREIFGLSMLPMDIPEDRPDEQIYFPVNDETFKSYAQLEDFVRSTYAKKESDSLLNSGKYKDVNGKLHGDISKDAGMGYYVNWNDYRFEIKNIKDKSADLTIYVTDDSPAGKEDITIDVKLLKEDDRWLLERMFS